ncbi:MAG TPA: hypothetical protein VG605_06795, partial [Puia sp.]|nr:hypothetical protein [Puia sp.]
MLPTSPEAAILGRFGDIPIGYYTGTTNVSIPLYTVKEAGLDIPITLSYHGSGIKVEDQASNVGLGWSLEPGGSIIQVVNGVEDDEDYLIYHDPTGYQTLRTGNITGSYSARPQMGYTMFGCSPPTTPQDDRQSLNDLLLGDGQPDIYMFNFGRYSGKFYINPETGQPIQLNKNDSIKFAYSGGVWTATTMDGDEYVFGVRETASTYNVTDHIGYTYKLTTIYVHNGKQIQFQYATGYSMWYTYSESYHSTYPVVPPPAGESLSGATPHSDYTQNNTLNLTKIITSEAIVNFNLEDRQDLMGEADNDTIPNNGVTSTKRIKSIDIISAIDSSKIRSFRFSYSYFPYSTVGGSYLDTAGKLNELGLRLRLDSITEVGYNSDGSTQSLPPYKFTYDGSSILPLKTSFARDFWGYYNGAHNTGLLPDLSYFNYVSDPDYQSVPSNLLGSTFYNQRAPDSASMLGAMLKRITYPTGGYTEFDYSPNTFSNHNYPDAAKLSLFQRQEILQDRNLGLPQDTLAYDLFLQQDKLVHFDCQINRGSPLQGLTFTDMQQASITLEKFTSGVETTVETWQIQSSDLDSFNATGGRHWTQDIQLSGGANIYYYLICNLPNSFGPQNTSENTAYVQCTYSFFDTSGNSFKRSLGGGVRVAGIRNYNSDGSIVGHKIIRYVNEDSSSSGLLMSPLVYYYQMPMNFREPLIGDGDPYWIGAYVNIWFISSESSVPYSQGAQGNVVGYSRVEVMDVAPDGSRNGLHVYEYNNQPSGYEIRMPDNPQLSNGLVSRETILNSGMDTLSQTVYTYKVIENASYNGIKMFSAYMGADPCDDPHDNGINGFTYGMFQGVAKYFIYFYPLNSVWYKTYQTTNRYFANSNILQDTTVDQ